LGAQWGTLTSAAPLAWNDSLSSAAANYSNLMVTLDQQAHNLGGTTLTQRITSTGYSSQLLEIGESLFAKAVDADHAHAALAVDWGPDGGSGSGIQPGATHRAALMDPYLKEIGIGFQTVVIPIGNINANGPLVLTEHFATSYRSNGVNLTSDAILTGVIFQDTVSADNFYTPGEGIGGALVFIYDNATNVLVASGQTNSAGGINITLTDLTDGVLYRVEAPSTGEPVQTFSLNSRVEDYGTVGSPALVTIYDNVYRSFAAVPEPSSSILLLCAALTGLKRRRLPN
ncbi:MAG: CAP domain-containing protein, partial [Prosthecobacter sp.]